MGKALKKFLINGAVLSLGSIILNAVDNAFTIYLSGRIGADGIGLFQLTMSVYRFGVTLALSGISLGTTRVVSEELSLGNKKGVVSAQRKSFFLSLLFGLLSGSFLFFLSPYLSSSVLNDIRTLSSLRALSLTLPFLSVSSSISGYFTAVRRITKSALGGFFSYFVRISVSVYFLSFLGIKSTEGSLLSIVYGMLFSEIANTIYLFICAELDKRRYRFDNKDEGKQISRILKISMPVALSSYIRSGLYTLEQLLIPIGLRKFSGSSEFSLAGYGLIRGMVMPVLLFGSAFIYSFSSLLVPELSECKKLNNTLRAGRIVERALSVTLAFGIGVSAFIYFFSGDLSVLLYGGPAAAHFLKMLSPLCAFMYIDGVVDNLLKGLGEEISVMRYNIIDSALSALLVYLLVPIMGVEGYVVVILVSEIFNTYLSLRRLIRVCSIRNFLRRQVVTFSVFGLILSGGCAILAKSFPIGTGSVFSLILGGLVYVGFGCVYLKKQLFSAKKLL